MTTREACSLLVDLTQQASDARAERDAWRLVAKQAIHHAASLQQRLSMIDRSEYVHRQRTAAPALEDIAA